MGGIPLGAAETEVGSPGGIRRVGSGGVGGPGSATYSGSGVVSHGR